MATKTKKVQAKPKKSTTKKMPLAKKPAVKKVATVKKKKVTTTKKATVKKSPAKKPAAKKAVIKKPAKKMPAAKKRSVVKQPMKKRSTAKKMTTTTKKKPSLKKTKDIKKPAVKPKKTVAPSLKRAKPQKPNLKIVVSNKEKIQPITKIAIKKTAEKIQTTAKVEPIEKGVKKKIMESLEVKPIKPSTAGLFGIPPYIEKSGEEYMNETQKNHFRDILRRWKKELMEEVDRTKSHMQDGATRHPDPSDNATQEEEFNLELRTRDRERKLIKKIDEALERIDQDDYGYCDACGIEIGIRRLEARPTAEMCIDCKTLDEIKEKQTRG